MRFRRSIGALARESGAPFSEGLPLNLKARVPGVPGSCGKIPGRFDFAHTIAVDQDGSIDMAGIKD